jgi:hypothetical protein
MPQACRSARRVVRNWWVSSAPISDGGRHRGVGVDERSAGHGHNRAHERRGAITKSDDF